MQQPGKLRLWFQGNSPAWPVMGLLALLGFNLIFADRFFHIEIRDGHLYGTTIDVLHQGSKVMLLSLGMTLVIATGGVDLSVGSLMAMAGAVGAMLAANSSLPFPAVAAAALGVSALAGSGNGLLVSMVRIQPIVATLILMVAGRGMAMLLTGGQIITFSEPAFVFMGNGHLLGIPFTVLLVALMCALTWVITRKTSVGLFVEAVGANETAARFSGVPARFIKVVVYAYSGFCAGLAGLIAASNIKAADSTRVGEMMELDAIFAVVVGGTALTGGRFTLAGSMVGAVLIQTLTTTMYNLGVAPSVAPVPKAVVILSVCLLQSARFRSQLRQLIW